MDLARLMPLEWSRRMVEMKVIWRRLMMSRRSSRHLDMVKPRIRLRTWAERAMTTTMAMTADDEHRPDRLGEMAHFE